MSVAVPQSPAIAAFRRLHGQTWLVAVTVYGGWGLVIWHAAALPWWLLLVLGAWLVGWYNSLQHETVLGLAAASRWISVALGMSALGLWMPYTVYRDSHLKYHRITHSRPRVVLF